MATLASINEAHVRAALSDVRRDGVPVGRGSTKFCLVVGGAHYPPKYVLALAARHALGRELRPNEFSGGPRTNSILGGLGLSVVPCTCRGAGQQPGATGSRAGTTRLASRSAVRGVPEGASAGPPGPGGRPARPSTSQPAAASVTITRIITQGRTPEDPKAEERILLDVFGKQWPIGVTAKFVLTPGGFVHGSWPRTWTGNTGWDSRRADLAPLLEAAELELATVVTERVFRAAAKKTDVLTIGIDLFDEESPAHVELVAVFDMKARRVTRWTGKSYPTSGQERTLVHIVDLDSHFLEIADERVLVLGCHDLNMFSPRGHANQSPEGLRRARCDEMKRKVARFKPTVVLQHPHSTDTPNIWRMPWLSLVHDVPSIKSWASGIAYYRNGKPRANLQRVRDLTAGGTAPFDLVVRSSDYG